jgi:hypothetical protein
MPPMTVSRSHDLSLLREAGELVSVNQDFNWEEWLDNDSNYMLTSDDDVGLATYEYPGVYTVHWFYISRGRKAINLAREMIGWMFENTDCQTIRGLTPVDNKAARWLAKQVGLRPYGILSFSNGDCELLIMTKDEYNG